MPTRFVVVPQWQGSGSSRAMRLIDGAEAIRGDLPSSATTVVDVPLGAGDAVGTTVHRLSAIAAVRERVHDALAAVPDEDLPVVIGGDCGVEVGAVQHALAAHPDLALVWFDAHADLHTPETSPSGAFHGMVVRTLLGDGPDLLTGPVPLPAGRLILAGLRACEPEEDRFIESAGVRTVEAASLADPEALIEAIAATGATGVYLHVDLDVLDPEEISGIGFPEPFGTPVAPLTTAIRAVAERFPVVGAGLTEFAPPSLDDLAGDMSAILRVLSALTASARRPG